jgi:signal transduction histidine kinase
VEDRPHIKKLEEQANRTGRLAAMGEMALKIAHEIRNPLGSIELCASLLCKGLEEDEDVKQTAAHISSGVQRINTIISNLLLFIRPEQKPEMRILDIHDPLKDSLFFAEHVVNTQTGIEVVTGYAAHALEIYGDPELLCQVSLNLVLNAIQAMADGGRLTISTRRVTDHRDVEMAEIRFTDTGCGIPPEYFPRIFDPFFTTKNKGTGLGLPIVHNITTAHGGNIDITSSPACGTQCIVTFPLCRPMTRAAGHALTE